METFDQSHEPETGLIQDALAHLAGLVSTLRCYLGPTKADGPGRLPRFYLRDVRSFLLIAEALLRRILLQDANTIIASRYVPPHVQASRPASEPATVIQTPEKARRSSCLFRLSELPTSQPGRSRATARRIPQSRLSQTVPADIWLARMERLEDVLENRSHHAERLANLILRRRKAAAPVPIRQDHPPGIMFESAADFSFNGPLLRLHEHVFGDGSPDP